MPRTLFSTLRRRSGAGDSGARRRVPSLALALAAGLALTACEEPAPTATEPSSRPVKLFTVDSGLGDEIRRFPATIEASKQAELGFRVSGQLAELAVREGDMVDEGAVIARLDPTDFEIALEDRSATFENTQSNFRRAQELIASRSISQLDYDRMEAEFRSARAALDQAKTNLSYATLRAPFRGRIAQRFVDNFEEVIGKQRVVFLQDTDMLDVIIAMPESVVRSVTAGDGDDALAENSVAESDAAEVRAMVSFEDYPEISYSLRIKEIATRADPDTQTFAVTFTMPQPDEFTVLPGMTAKVDVDFTGLLVRQTVTWVPVTAVQADADLEPRVFVLDPQSMTVASRPVDIGRVSGDMLEVLAGLEGGEEIVAVGAAYLADGMRVTRLATGEQAIPRDEAPRAAPSP